MTFTNSIIPSWNEREESNQDLAISLSLLGSGSLLGSSSLPPNWNRDNLGLHELRHHPHLWSTLMRYHDSLKIGDFSQFLNFQSRLANLNAYSMKTSAIQHAILLLAAQKKTLDSKPSSMLLRHPAVLSQSLMENPSPMILGSNHFMCGHHALNIININSRRRPMHTFPHRLHEILSNPEYSEFITWLPNGFAWKILQRKQFEAFVIPRHFRHGRFTSFMRQVNGWGFKRTTDDPDQNIYYHQYFVKGLPHLCLKMRRHSEK